MGAIKPVIRSVIKPVVRSVFGDESPTLFGFPTRGLVALIVPGWDVRGRNILPVGAEDFVTGWGGTVGNPTWDTTEQAYTKTFLTASSWGTVRTSLSPLQTYTFSIEVKSGTKSITKMSIFDETSQANILAPTNYSISSSLQRYSWSFTTPAGCTSVRVYVERDSGVAGSIFFRNPCLNIGSLTPYSAPAGLPQSLADFSNHGNPFQLGSAAGADTNDPTLTAQGAVFGADDYLKSASSVFDDMGQFTCVTACVVNSIGSGGRLWSKGTREFMVLNGNVLRYFQSRTVSGDWKSATAFSLGSPFVSSVAYNKTTPDNAPNIWVGNTKSAIVTTATGSGDASSDATCDLYIGNVAAANRTIDGSIYAQVWYSRVLADSEYLQSYRAMQRLCLALGVTT